MESKLVIGKLPICLSVPVSMKNVEEWVSGGETTSDEKAKKYRNAGFPITKAKNVPNHFISNFIGFQRFQTTKINILRELKNLTKY